MAHGHEDKYWPLGIPAHYGKVWAILTALFVVSYCGPLVAPHVSEWINPTVGKVVLMSTAFGIAILKASLVVKEFMHLPLERKFIWYIEGIVVAFMFLFFFAVAPDVMHHEGRNWENRAAAESVERGMKAGAEGEGHHGEGSESEHAAEVREGKPSPSEMLENNARKDEGGKRESH